jgi:aspartyl-tRNA(Asn)/glutamyl-tRNA(Gln) amidotransferase subunit A
VVDVIVTPTTPTPAERYHLDALAAGELDPRGFAKRVAFTFPFNLGGHPAAQVPCGRVGELPVGLQVAGPRGADGLVLDVAAAVERSVGALGRPRVYVDLLRDGASTSSSVDR